MKILVLGYRGSGKDEFAKILSEKTGLKYTNVSIKASEEFIKQGMESIKVYETVLDCYNDRDNYRDCWFRLFNQYTEKDKSRFVKKVLEDYDIYAGLRDKEQVLTSLHLFDVIVWTDASERVGVEDESSCNVTPDLADHIIDNNGTFLEFLEEIDKFVDKIKYNVYKRKEIHRPSDN